MTNVPTIIQQEGKLIVWQKINMNGLALQELQDGDIYIYLAKMWTLPIKGFLIKIMSQKNITTMYGKYGVLNSALETKFKHITHLQSMC